MTHDDRGLPHALYQPLADCGDELVHRGPHQIRDQRIPRTKITFTNEIADLAEKVGADMQELARSVGLDPPHWIEILSRDVSGSTSDEKFHWSISRQNVA